MILDKWHKQQKLVYLLYFLPYLYVFSSDFCPVILFFCVFYKTGIIYGPISHSFRTLDELRLIHMSGFAKFFGSEMFLFALHSMIIPMESELANPQWAKKTNKQTNTANFLKFFSTFTHIRLF